MLETSLLESGGRGQTRKPMTVLVSTALHAIVIIALLFVPLVQPQVVPAFSATIGIPLPVVSKPDAPKPQPASAEPVVQPHIVAAANDFITPIAIPDGIALVDDPPVGIAAVASTPSTGIRSLLGNLRERPDTSLTPPPPPPPPPARPMAPIRVGTMERANLIRQVMPQY